MEYFLKRFNQKLSGTNELPPISTSLLLLPPSILKEVIDTISTAISLFPIISQYLTSVNLRFFGLSTIAAIMPKEDKEGNITFELQLNVFHWLSNSIRRQLKDDFDSGISSTSTIAGTIMHEMVHVLNGIIILQNRPSTFWIDWNSNLTAKNMLLAANFDFQSDAKFVSGYATTDEGELLAEALSAALIGELSAMDSIKNKEEKLLQDVINYFS